MNKGIISTLLTLSAGLFSSALAAATPPTLSLESLSPEMANKMVVAAVSDCTARGYKVAAAVVGRDGNLLALLRNPLSGPHTATVSQRKAYAAATFQTSTAAMQSRTDLSYIPGVLLIVGGIPIDVGGKFYGGIAVSGAEPDVDEKCAEAGLAAVKEVLEFTE